MKEIKEALNKISYDSGCILFGIADIKNIKQSFNILPTEILSDLECAISLGYVLSASILSTNVESPSQLYANHYKKINILLEISALKIASFLHNLGYKALPVPVSQLLDWKNFSAHLSHRKIAFLAGHGWMGRNNLLVNQKFGAQVRYVSILTNCPLPLDKPLAVTCPPDCYYCKEVCPVNAIGETYENFDLKKCLEKLTTFSRTQGIGQHICGICVNACKGDRNRSRQWEK